MRKIIILFSFMLLLSGCSANYSLVFEDGIYKESLSLVSKRSDVINNQSIINYTNDYYNNITLLVNYMDEPGDMTEEEVKNYYEIYEKSIIDNNDGYGLRFSHDYNNNTITNSNIIFNMFSSINFNNNKIYISGAKDIFSNYPYLDEIIISFKTDKYIKSTNSDSRDGNVYYWYLNRDNYKTKKIDINFTDVYIESLNNKVNIDSNKFADIVIYISLIIILIGILFMFTKFKKAKK